MRIGLICPYSFDEPGGVQAHILDLASVFLDEGHYVRVLGPAALETEVPDFVVRGGRSIPISYNGSVARLGIGPRVARAVRRFIREGDFDVLHIHEPNSPSFSMSALRLAHGPIVATYHASASNSLILNLAKPLLAPFLEKIRGGIAVSELARRWQVEQLGGDPVLIPNGVDTSVYAAARQEAESNPHAGTPVHIIFLGRLDEPRKGLNVLLDALHHMSAVLGKDVRCTVIGGGRVREYPNDGVHFAGRVSDAEKARLLAEADIYVAPNTGGESFGIVLVEAMAAGCAVVASDLEAFAAVCDVGSDEPAGELFTTGDSRALAQTLDRLVSQPGEREALVRAGIRRAQSFDWEHVAARVMQVYETVQDGSKVRLHR